MPVGGRCCDPAEHALQRNRSRRRDRDRAGHPALHRDRLPGHGLRRPPRRRTRWRVHQRDGRAPRCRAAGVRFVHRVPRPRTACLRTSRPTRGRRRCSPTTCATSSSRRARPGRPKGAMLFHAASIRAFTEWCDIVGLRTGDRYLVVSPFFHTFGVKAGDPRVAARGRHHHPAPGVRRSRGDATFGRGARHRPARRRRPLFQAILNHPDRRAFDLSKPASHRATGATSVPTQLPDRPARANSASKHGRHGIRAHRDPRRQHHVPARRRARGDREDGRALTARGRRGARGRRPPGTHWPPASRARSSYVGST